MKLKHKRDCLPFVVENEIVNVRITTAIDCVKDNAHLPLPTIPDPLRHTEKLARLSAQPGSGLWFLGGVGRSRRAEGLVLLRYDRS